MVQGDVSTDAHNGIMRSVETADWIELIFGTQVIPAAYPR